MEFVAARRERARADRRRSILCVAVQGRRESTEGRVMLWKLDSYVRMDAR